METKVVLNTGKENVDRERKRQREEEAKGTTGNEGREE